MILKNKIKKIIDAIKDTNIAEIEISSFWGLQKIKLKKGIDYSESLVNKTNHDPVINKKISNEEIIKNDEKIDSQLKNNNIFEDLLIVKAPLVGTYYQSQKPEDPPFVEINSKINSGDTLCIIEAMKIFNDIEAEYSGVIKEILVNNGDPVEYDQPLFKIQKI